MNANYILVALAVLTIACIYLFWLTFKQSQEIQALSSRVNNGEIQDGGGDYKNNKFKHYALVDHSIITAKLYKQIINLI